LSLYAQSLRVAIAQTAYSTIAGSETQALRQLLVCAELGGLLVQQYALYAISRFPLSRLTQRRLDHRRKVHSRQ
jgi:hypothetical protein